MDLGTQGAKGILINCTGEVIASAHYPYKVISNSSGWAEQEPSSWWDAIKKICKQLKESNPIGFDNIVAVGLSGQMHSLIFLSSEGEVLRNAILWADSRGRKECIMMEELFTWEERKRISNPIMTAYSAPKILWVRNNENEIWRKTSKLLFVKDYIRLRLCGNIYTDASDASGTLFYDFENNNWDCTILSKLQIDVSLLPPIVNSTDISGHVSTKAARELGLKEAIPIATGGGDLACGLLGSGVIGNDMILIMLGTSGQVMIVKDQVEEDKIGKVYYYKHLNARTNFAMGALAAAGYSLGWFKDSMCELEDYIEKRWGINSFGLLTLEAEKSGIGAQGLIFLPYLQGSGSPYMDEVARGVIIGLGAYHTKNDIIRALMEGVIMGIRDSVELIKEENTVTGIRFVGGGSKSSLWRKILSDVLGNAVTTLKISDASAYGAALLAGVGIGMFESLDQAAKLVQTEDEVIPDLDNTRKYEELYSIYKGLYSTLKNDFERIARFRIVLGAKNY